MLTLTSQSHLDHHLTLAHVRFLLDQFGDRESFFAETVVLPEYLDPLPCGLRGPAVGQPQVPDNLIVWKERPPRTWKSRVLDTTSCAFQSSLSFCLPVLERRMTVIAGPGLGLPCVLYTAYGGPLAPREPDDPGLPEAERAASVAFWREHALCL